MARVGDRADAQVVFLQPSGVNDDWVQTDLWHRAIGIPGVSVRSDHDGVEARRFGVATSGEALLYDRAGRLIFAGGITAARGHSGDNEGRAALVDLLTDHSATHAGTPVFGCPLFDSAAHCTKEGAVQCRRS